MTGRRSGLLLAVCLFAATPAFATGTIECSGVSDPDIEVFVLVSRAPVLNVLRASIAIGGEVYATREPGLEAPEGSVPIRFGQGIATADGVRIDFTDDMLSEVLITLRTLVADGDKMSVEAGVISVLGSDVAAVTCARG